MGKCEVCNNEYDKCFLVSIEGKTHTFDCFECAIHMLAPTCNNCGVKIVGHGMEDNGNYYCCEHCGQAKGVKGLSDRTVHVES